MKKRNKTEYIDFNKDDLKNLYPPLNDVQIKDRQKRIAKWIYEVIAYVEDNEIKDMNMGDEFNKAHAEFMKVFESVSVFKNGEEWFVKGLKNSFLKLQGREWSCNDADEKKKLNDCIKFIEAEIKYFDTSNSEFKKSEETTHKKETESATKRITIPLPKNDKLTYETLDVLFKDQENIEPCINVLRCVKTPLIDNELNYIGKSKSAFGVWMDEMRRQGFIRHCTEKEYILLLNEKFSGLNIKSKDGSTFRKPNLRAENNYRDDFKNLLSQISQKGRKGK
jgi:hypothetical protein